MNRTTKFQLKVLPGGQSRLEVLHDQVMNLLHSQEKQGIRELLERNNDSCQKLLFPYFKSGENSESLITALAGILEAHAKECYTIGYLDCIINGNQNKAD